MEKIKIYSLFFMAGFHILISFYTVTPGHLCSDEVTYHMMTRSFSDFGGLEIWNGYDEFPSRELETSFIFARNGRLVSQYPYLFPVLAKPFYQLWGYRGLFFINALAYIGIVVFCFLIGKKLFQDRNLALNACLIFILATYSWEYSQAAWPHATGTFFLMAAFYLLIHSLYTENSIIALYTAFLAGLITGFAVGIRLDSLFVLPCLMLPFLFMNPWRPWCALAAGFGSLPGLLILSATNYKKFGVFSFLSYGRTFGSPFGLAEIKTYLPFVPLMGLMFAIVWFLKKSTVKRTIHHHKNRFVLLLIVLTIGLSMMPQVRHFAKKPLNGAYQLIVDFRVRDVNIHERALSRTASGAMVYRGALKKSLLQSCPYLVVLLLPILRILRFEKDAEILALLFLVPLIFIGFYAYRYGWHGGFCWNLRYFIPILPFTSILTAYTWRAQIARMNRPWPKPNIRTIVTITSIILYVGGLIWLTSGVQGSEHQEFTILTMPLILAIFLLILLIIPDKFSVLKDRILPRTILTLFFTAMVWSFSVAIMYDFSRAYHLRRYHMNIANMASDLDLADAIIFTNNYIIFSNLIDKGHVRIACPVRDQYINFPDDFDDMIAYHLHKGHSVYTAFNLSIWNKINHDGFLDNFSIEPLDYEENFILSKISTGQICKIEAKHETDHPDPLLQ